MSKYIQFLGRSLRKSDSAKPCKISYLDQSTYHPAYAATPGPRRLEGEHHRIGICGGNADLCGQCHEWELVWHLEVARKIGAATPVLPGEKSEAYWQRAGGQYLDTYIEARREAYRVASERERERVANVLREQASLDNICRGMDDD